MRAMAAGRHTPNLAFRGGCCRAVGAAAAAAAPPRRVSVDCRPCRQWFSVRHAFKLTHGPLVGASKPRRSSCAPGRHRQRRGGEAGLRLAAGMRTELDTICRMLWCPPIGNDFGSMAACGDGGDRRPRSAYCT